MARIIGEERKLDHKIKVKISDMGFFEIDVTLAKWKDDKAWINNSFGTPFLVKRKIIEMINSPIKYSYLIRNEK